MELDDEVGERCGLLGARRRVADRNDARAALLDDSGIAVELFEERYSCASARYSDGAELVQARRFCRRGALRLEVIKSRMLGHVWHLYGWQNRSRPKPLLSL